MALSKSSADSATAYLIGLTLNLGTIVVFQLLIQAFSFVNPNCTPGSTAFISILKKYSARITYQIASYWQLPEKVTQTLKLQLNIKDKVSLVNISHKYPLAEFTFEANTISQVKWLFQEKKTTEEKISEITQILLSEVLTEYESKS